jgi:ABC-type dipeptide/oligopeptide/nickel transport system permease component
LANLNRQYLLDQSLFAQWFHYMGNLLRGELGVSYYFVDRSVSDILIQSFPASFVLGFSTLVLSLVLGVVLGVLGAWFEGRPADFIIRFVTISGLSLPTFFVAPVLILVFAMKLDLFPPAQWGDFSHLVLPMLALSIRPICLFARLIRATALDLIKSDFVRTLRAKGLSDFHIFFKHILKSGLVSMLSILGMVTTNLITGSFIIELIFNIPGLGRHLVNSVANRDYPLVMGLTLAFATILLISNFISDILVKWADPRAEVSQ